MGNRNKYFVEYNKESRKRYSLNMGVADQDILDAIDGYKNKQGRIKSLIRLGLETERNNRV